MAQSSACHGNSLRRQPFRIKRSHRNGTNRTEFEHVTVQWNIPETLAGTDEITYAWPCRARWIYDAPDTTTGLVRTGIRFNRLVSDVVHARGVRWKKYLAAVAAAFLACVIVLLKTRNVVSFWYDPLIQLYSMGAAAYVVSRVIFSMFYREPADRGVLKSVSLIIAVKNEEDHITETVERCFQSHYPAHLVEVMVIDDGSNDRTWDVLNGLQARFPGLTLSRFEKDRGKRHAMALGRKRRVAKS